LEQQTRKLSYRNDDYKMRPIHGCPGWTWNLGKGGGVRGGDREWYHPKEPSLVTFPLSTHFRDIVAFSPPHL